MEHLDVDDFMRHGLDSDSNGPPSDDESKSEKRKKKKKKLKKKTEETADDGRPLVTLALVNKWQRMLQKQPSLSAIRLVVAAFTAAAERAGADVESQQFALEDTKVFDALISLCFNELSAVWHSLLRQTENEKDTKRKDAPGNRFRNWKRYKSELRQYLTVLTKLFGELQDEGVVTATVRHVSDLLDFYVVFPKLAKVVLKLQIRAWSRSSERCRVLAFVNIAKMVSLQPDMFGLALKNMYLAYVQNTKLVTQQTWPIIQFMQTSFGQLCMKDPPTTYQYAFVYIRQMAIHLRNATIAKKKDLVQAVYNWQYVQCIYLWAKVLSLNYANETVDQSLHELTYPLVQVTLAAARLIPTVRYFALRFQCVRALLKLQAATNIYIPISPLLTEVLSHSEFFNKRHTRQTVKPLQLNCLIKASKSQMLENGFKDATMDAVCELLLACLQLNADSPAFPEIVLPALNAMKVFLKECKVANYCRQLKGLCDKIEEQRKHVIESRMTHEVDLSDLDSVAQLSESLAQNTGPLTEYYKSCKALRKRQQKIKTPDQQKARKMKRAKEDSESESEESDSENEDEDEEDDEEDEMPKKKRKVTEQKEKRMMVDISVPDANSDIVQDLVLSDDD